MTDTYSQVKEQLDGIVEQVRKKDVSLERSLDLLEEGVALANRCTELIDQAAWEDASDSVDDGDSDGETNFEDDAPGGEADTADTAAVADDMSDSADSAPEAAVADEEYAEVDDNEPAA